MSHKDRSIANMRCEAKRIYNQRRYINKLEKDKKELQQRIDKAIEYVNNHIHQETFTGYMDSYELKKLLELLKVKE